MARRKFKARPARYERYRVGDGYRWNVRAMNGCLLGNGGQGYSRGTDCDSAAVACALAILRSLAPALLAGERIDTGIPIEAWRALQGAS